MNIPFFPRNKHGGQVIERANKIISKISGLPTITSADAISLLSVTDDSKCTNTRYFFLV